MVLVEPVARLVAQLEVLKGAEFDGQSLGEDDLSATQIPELIAATTRWVLKSGVPQVGDWNDLSLANASAVL